VHGDRIGVDSRRMPGPKEGLMRLVIAAIFSVLVICAVYGSNKLMVENATKFKLNSHSFSDRADIPKKYTCDGDDVSPELHWTDQPPAAKSFVLIVDDPDAPSGPWVHWVLFDLPGDAHDLPEGAGKSAPLPSGAQQGINDFKKTVYGGPCPPPGKPHRYFFKLYALDSKLSLKASPAKAEVEKAMQGHILGQAELVGRYRR
jgi:Raf kinase inhibitor-like YbhB/YbcL family protein